MSEQPRSPAEGPPQGEEFVWCHVIVTTYGAWLDGDVRGFRTRHHREHIEGDYKDPPPPERYAGRRRRSREALKNPPVSLDQAWKAIIGQALVERFQELGGFVLVAAMSTQHGHLLVKLPRGVAREWTGIAKKHAWFVAREAGWVGKLWGIRSKAIEAKNREYQRSVYRYILSHEKEGAWVWKWQPPKSPVTDEQQAASPGVAPPGPPDEGRECQPPSPGVAPPGRTDER